MYVVIKPFTYAGQTLEIGAPWEPSGHPNDAAIVRARLVLEQPDAEEPAALEQPRTRGRRPRRSAAPAWQEDGV